MAAAKQSNAQNYMQVGFEFANFDTLKVLNGSDLITTGYTGTQDNNNQGNYFYMPIDWDTSFGGYWRSGWAISKVIDTTEGEGDYAAQLYAARPGTGFKGVFDQNWAVGQQGSKLKFVDLSEGAVVFNGFHYTNTTFGYNVMKRGNMFAKKFGGSSGNDADSLILVGKLYRHNKMETAIDTFRVALADFRFADNSQDYIVKDWRYVDMKYVSSTLPAQGWVADSLEFALEGSDNDPQFGLNTPAFFAVDGFLFSFYESVQKFNKTELTVSPNPAQNWISLSTKSQPKMIQVMDMTGKIWMPKATAFEGGQFFQFQLDLSALPMGVYQVTVVTESGMETAKVVKADSVK